MAEDHSNDKNLTLDEIERLLNQIARDPDAGVARMRALAMLSSMKAAGAVQLPEPLDESEVLQRLQRVMKPCGRALCRIAYARSFAIGGHKGKITDRVDFFQVDDTALTLDEREMCRSASRSLRVLYRHFPELKRPGIPTGYPTTRGEAAKTEFRYEAAVKALQYRQQKELDRAAKEAKLEPTDGTRSIPEPTP